MTVINIAIVAAAYATIAILIYFLRSEKSRFSRKQIITFIIMAGVVFAACYPFWERRFGDSVQALDLYIILVFIFTFPPAFFIYPKRPNKNFFFICLCTPLTVVGHGFGNLAELSFAPNQLIGRILNLFVMSACFALILTGLYWLTRKKFPGLFENENPVLWRRLWIITVLMGWTQIVAGNVFSGSTFTAAGIIPSRLICLAGTVAILYIAGLAKRQAEESADAFARAAAAEEAVNAKEKEYAEIVAQTEETNRLRHDRRQIIAAITGLNESGMEKELESYCLEALEQLDRTEITV
ncbi:MAG: hypothetical protein LBM41_03555 [Ruminococcus sp.]|jgi:hypothetical protein|nr:hypothetical protein [Ruminococcus sp.]